LKGCGCEEREDSAVHKWVPPQRSLITFATSAEGPATASFRVPIPDSRLRVKISLLFVPTASENPTDISGSATLWLAETDWENSGVTGRTIALTNIEGTKAAPTAIAAAVGLLGYSREFVSAGDAIEGVFVATNPDQLGTWVLQARYQPDAVRFTNREWNEIKNQCNPYLITAPVVL